MSATTTGMDAALDAVLPPGVARVLDEDPPAAPTTFGAGYVLPAHSEKPLQCLHPHPLDARLVFYEGPHVYTFDGAALSCSVTPLAHQFESHFVPEDAIALMKGSRAQAWPRLEYACGVSPGVTAWSPEHGLLLTSEGKTVGALQPHTMSAECTVAEARAVLALTRKKPAWGDTTSDEADRVLTFDRAMTDDEIKQMWADKGREASHRGTEAHYMAERFFNGLTCRWWEGEMAVLFAFARQHMLPHNLVAWHTEKEIVCADADVAGSIDLIVWDAASGLYHIIDHKRSDKLETQMRGYSKMGGVMTHLDDCKGASYALQTSIYQYILERDYGMPIGDRVLLSLHPDRPFTTSVPYLRAEVEYIMESRIALTAARRRVAAADARFKCSLSGLPAVDAVRVSSPPTEEVLVVPNADGGQIASEKAAMVQGLDDAVPEETLRAAFAEAVRLEYTPPTLRRESCIAWKRQMPVGGLRPTWGRTN